MVSLIVKIHILWVFVDSLFVAVAINAFEKYEQKYGKPQNDEVSISGPVGLVGKTCVVQRCFQHMLLSENIQPLNIGSQLVPQTSIIGIMHLLKDSVLPGCEAKMANCVCMASEWTSSHTTHFLQVVRRIGADCSKALFFSFVKSSKIFSPSPLDTQTANRDCVDRQLALTTPPCHRLALLLGTSRCTEQKVPSAGTSRIVTIRRYVHVATYCVTTLIITSCVSFLLNTASEGDVSLIKRYLPSISFFFPICLLYFSSWQDDDGMQDVPQHSVS